VYYSVALQNKSNTTSPHCELHVVSVYVWWDGASTWRAREKNRQRWLCNGPRLARSRRRPVPSSRC